MNIRAERFLARLSAARARGAFPILIISALLLFALSLAVHLLPMTAFDQSVTLSVQRLRTPALDRWVSAVTFLGNTWTLVATAFAGALVLALYRRAAEAMLVLLSLLALPLNILLKALVDRPRPTEDLVAIVISATGLSFPSGHAMSSAALYGVFALVAWTLIPARTLRNLTVAGFILTAILIGLSRIYLGAHWFSDVIGGWTGGLFFVALLDAVEIRTALARRREMSWDSSASRPG